MHLVTSSQLAKKFIDYATGGTGEFEGKPGFSDKVREAIRTVAELKTGRSLLQELLASGRSITILEGSNQGIHEMIGGNWLDPTNSSISLNFDRKLQYMSLNKNGERILVEIPLAVLLSHEATHYKHLIVNAQALERRARTASSISDMTTQEEELTITGKVTDTGEEDSCHENAILAELELPPRLSHEIYIAESPIEDFQCMILGKITGSLREKLASPEGQREAIALQDELLPFAVKLMCDSESQEELTKYATIIHLFISQGCKSDLAFENLFDRPHPEYLIIAQQLLAKGCKSNRALESVVELMKTVDDQKMRIQYLRIIQDLISAGCRFDRALASAAKQANLECNPQERRKWFSIIHPHMQDGAKPFVLDDIVAIIKHNDDQPMKKRWAELIKTSINEVLDASVLEMQEDFCENLKELIDAGYSSIVLELFTCAGELFPQRSQELQKPLKILHHFIDKKLSIEEVKKFLKEKCANSSLDTFVFLDSLIRSTLYIALQGKNCLIRFSPEHLYLPQFQSIKAACELIISKSERQETASPSRRMKFDSLFELLRIKHTYYHS